MSRHDPDIVNRLIGEFSDLQEIWKNQPEKFDWSRLEALAKNGAQAYNEGAGPSFHALALDGVEHGEFHERFLAFLLRTDFDPFKLVRPGTGVAPVPVIDHLGLSDAAFSNPSSARMRSTLMDVARERFASLAEDPHTNNQTSSVGYTVLEACIESIPLDLLDRIAPELATQRRAAARRRYVNPVEGYLSPAEVIVESGHAPYG